MLTRAVSADEQAQRIQTKDNAIINTFTEKMSSNPPDQAFSVQESSGD